MKRTIKCNIRLTNEENEQIEEIRWSNRKKSKAQVLEEIIEKSLKKRKKK